MDLDVTLDRLEKWAAWAEEQLTKKKGMLSRNKEKEPVGGRPTGEIERDGNKKICPTGGGWDRNTPD